MGTKPYSLAVFRQVLHLYYWKVSNWVKFISFHKTDEPRRAKLIVLSGMKRSKNQLSSRCSNSCTPQKSVISVWICNYCPINEKFHQPRTSIIVLKLSFQDFQCRYFGYKARQNCRQQENYNTQNCINGCTHRLLYNFRKRIVNSF